MSSQTTQAWRYHKGGLLPNILKLDKVEVPAPGKGEIMVNVEYSALNPVDFKFAQHLSFLTKKPRTVGADFSGKVAALGPGTEDKDLKVGDAVYGMIPIETAMKNGRGSLTTQLLVSSRFVEKIPEAYSSQQAAGLTLVGLTALALASHAQKGERVLVAGGSTAVGLLLIKMLKAKGCSLIVATGSGGKLDVIKSRGADDVVDYRASDFPKDLASRYSKQPFDVILDTVGDQPTHSACGSYLKKRGHYWNVGANSVTPGEGGVFKFIRFLLSAYFLPTFLGGVPVKFHNIAADNSKMDEFATLVREIDLDPLIDSILEVAEAPKAYQRLMEGRALGKIIVEVKQ